MTLDARAFDLRAHGDEHRRQIGDFRLSRAVLHHRFAVSQDRGHQQIFRSGYGDFVEDDVRAFQPVGPGLQIAVLLDDGGAHRFQALDMQVDGTAADGASAGHGDARQSGAGDQWPQNKRTTRAWS